MSSLKALCRLVFSPAAATSPSLPIATLWPFLDAICSEDVGTAVRVSLVVLHEVVALMGSSLLGAALLEVMDVVANCRFKAEAEAEATTEESLMMQML
ncbi:hypothetical protein GUJ93_ZPchr0008g11955 [Zizania palustris]|uniref:Uncharacterized protein n=1 Tax=Zizania palustris TaxID=103762 RepID=A0A8J5V245_ZIZPA|nr:hypothetical protein GUJ93_ZPchr0008g11955 [Zizania palustris]